MMTSLSSCMSKNVEERNTRTIRCCWLVIIAGWLNNIVGPGSVGAGCIAAICSDGACSDDASAISDGDGASSDGASSDGVKSASMAMHVVVEVVVLLVVVLVTGWGGIIGIGDSGIGAIVEAVAA
jgi:hypothetical protein